MPDALAAAYDVLLLDLDGVVYIGGTAIPGAPEALQRASERGTRLAYVTNNASRTPAAVAAILTGMGVPAKPTDVVTSAQAAARLLAEKLPRRRRSSCSAPWRCGSRSGSAASSPSQTRPSSPQAVVQGFSPGIGYGSLAEGGLAVRAGALFVGTNADSTIPSARGTAPGNGSLLQVIEHATGVKPQIAGKPEPPLHRGRSSAPAPSDPLVIGDRLDTDIEAAYNADAHSLLVLTGVDNPRSAVLHPRTAAPPTSPRPSTPCSSRIPTSPAPTTARPAPAGPRPPRRPTTARSPSPATAPMTASAPSPPPPGPSTTAGRPRPQPGRRPPRSPNRPRPQIQITATSAQAPPNRLA